MTAGEGLLRAEVTLYTHAGVTDTRIAALEPGQAKELMALLERFKSAPAPRMGTEGERVAALAAHIVRVWGPPRLAFQQYARDWYLLPPSNPAVRELCLRFKRGRKIPMSAPLSDGERLEFELALLRPGALSVFERETALNAPGG